MRFVLALNEVCFGRRINALMEGWLEDRIDVEWKRIDPFHVRKWVKLRCKGMGRKELKSAPDAEFPQLGGQRAVTLAPSRQATGD